jgi:hypothetical protein
MAGGKETTIVKDETSFLAPIKDQIIAAFKTALPDKPELIKRLESKIDNIDIDDRPDSFGTYPEYGVVIGSWWALEALWCCAYAVSVFSPLLESAVDEKRTVVHLQRTAGGRIEVGLLNWAFRVASAAKRMPWLHGNAWSMCLMAILIDILLQWRGSRKAVLAGREQSTCEAYDTNRAS